MMGHYLLKGIPKEFTAQGKKSWVPHPLNLNQGTLSTVKHNYTVLAENDRQEPVILTHANTVATAFPLKEKESIQLFANFVRHIFEH